jgi:hypothetical protein
MYTMLHGEEQHHYTHFILLAKNIGPKVATRDFRTHSLSSLLSKKILLSPVAEPEEYRAGAA